MRIEPFRGGALCVGLLLSPVAQPVLAEEGAPRGELIFPLESWHNHGSSLVEGAEGELLVVWFHGSGERQADDVEILGARRREGVWSAPFPVVDTPGFPDTNCTLVVGPGGQLWLFWPTILANRWETALMKYRVASRWRGLEGPPVWERSEVLHMKPGDDFEQMVRRKTGEYFAALGLDGPDGEGKGDPASQRARDWAERNYAQAADKLTRRLGWFTRAHPIVLDDERLLVGLYSDGFSFSSAVFTDDGGETWRMSEPIVGGGAVQPSFARRRNGTLVAFMRDNGPPPKRIQVAESRDRGETWSVARDHPDLVDSGAGNEVLVLRSGLWILVHNDVEEGRHRLAVSISEDEGTSFRRRRYLERTEPGEGRFHYPSVIQARDGSIHVSYSYHLPERSGSGGKSIKHLELEESWLRAAPGSR